MNWILHSSIPWIFLRESSVLFNFSRSLLFRPLNFKDLSFMAPPIKKTLTPPSPFRELADRRVTCTGVSESYSVSPAKESQHGLARVYLHDAQPSATRHNVAA